MCVLVYQVYKKKYKQLTVFCWFVQQAVNVPDNVFSVTFVYLRKMSLLFIVTHNGDSVISFQFS